MATATEAPAVMAEGPTSHTQNQAAALAKMAAPFAPSQIAKLPKVTCKDCTRAQYKVCDKPDHRRQKCGECSSNMTSAHVHLDYVGHADLTGRLLEADPLWTWEPMAFDQDGLPKFDHNGGLWIRLTVAGHSRLGYGDSQGKTGPNAVKEAIGDALRNAGMRFGAALDLWSKTDQNKAKADREELSREPSREDRLEDLYSLMQKRWGHLEGLRAVKVMVGEELFHESQVRDQAGKTLLFGELIDARIRELIEAEKVQRFLKGMRAGWKDLAATENNLAEARAKGMADATIPYGTPESPTRIEDVLLARIAELNPTGGRANQAGGPQVPPDGPDPIDQLMGQVQRHWDDELELTKVMAEAARRGQLTRDVEGPVAGSVLKFGDLVSGRIAELKQLAQAAEQVQHDRDMDRSAA